MMQDSLARRLLLVPCVLALLAASAVAGQAIAYRLEKAGRVSMAVYDAQGRMLRTLLAGEPQEAGEHRVVWDGLDREGKPAAPGSYTWKLIRHGGLRAEYLLSLGTSVGHASWPGQHGGPHAVDVADGQLYMTASMCEGSPQAVKVGLADGAIHWEFPTQGGWHQGADLAVLGDRVYFISARHYNDKPNEHWLYVMSATTGRRVASWGQKRLPAAPQAGADEQKDGVLVDRLDAGRDVLIAAARSGVVAWLDPEKGTVLDTARVDGEIRDVAAAPDGAALVLVGTEVLRIPRAAKQPEPVVRGLAAPVCLDADLATGRLFVFEGGDLQQVKRFGPKGKLEATFGREGGRRTGLYKPEDFRDVADLCADGSGGFIVAETAMAPRRTSQFDSSGRLVREWLGGQQFYTFAAPDPDDPTSLWMDSQWGWVMNVQADYAKRTWRVRACYPWPGQFERHMLSGYKMAQRHFVVRTDLDGDGRKEVLLRAASLTGYLCRPDEQAGVLRPVAALTRVLAAAGWNWHKVPVEELPKPWLEAGKLKGIDLTARNVRQNHLGYAWADADGDHAVDANELRLHKGDVMARSGCLFLTDALDIYTRDGWGPGNSGYTVHPATGYTATGAPIWDFGTLRRSPEAYRVGSTQDLRIDAKGSTYIAAHTAGDGYSIGGVHNRAHGWNWPGTQIAGCGVFKWDAKGVPLWQVGHHASRFRHGRGQLHYPVQIHGPVKGCIGVSDKIVHPCELWTEDGLYVGGVLDGHVADGLPEWAYVWWRQDPIAGSHRDHHGLHQYDMILGGSLVELPSGEVLWIGAGWNNCPVFRIHGLDGLARKEGRVAVRQPARAAEGKGTGLRAEYYFGEKIEGEPRHTSIDKQVWFGHVQEPRKTRNPWPKLRVPPPTVEDILDHGDAAELTKDDERGGELPKGAKAPPEAAALDFPKTFTVRWTGFLEPRFAEPYTFSAYYQDARLWVGGRRIELKPEGGQWRHKFFSEPVPLEAGRKVPIRVEWTATEGAKSEAHLNWESPTQAIEHIPTSALYPSAKAP